MKKIDYEQKIFDNFSQIVRDIRSDLGLSQLEFSKRLDIGISTIQRWESKESHVIKIDYLILLSEISNKKISLLIGKVFNGTIYDELSVAQTIFQNIGSDRASEIISETDGSIPDNLMDELSDLILLYIKLDRKYQLQLYTNNIKELISSETRLTNKQEIFFRKKLSTKLKEWKFAIHKEIKEEIELNN